MACHSLLQGIFPIQGSNLGLLHCRQILYHLSSQDPSIPASALMGPLSLGRRFFVDLLTSSVVEPGLWPVYLHFRVCKASFLSPFPPPPPHLAPSHPVGFSHLSLPVEMSTHLSGQSPSYPSNTPQPNFSPGTNRPIWG